MRSDLDWEGLRCLLAVLREGSLSGAARALNLAQPTVRRRIESLEHRLGTALFTRTGTGLEPTDAALALRGHAEAMAHSAEALARTATGGAAEIAGTVRITASEVIAIEVLPPLLTELSETHPRLTVELSCSNRQEDILRREADIAVRMVRPVQQALVATRVGEIILGLHARPEYLARHGTPRTLEEARAHRLIGVERDSALFEVVRTRGFEVWLNDFDFRSASDLAQLAMIRAGYGIGMCQVALAARAPALVRVVPHFGLPLETWVVMHQDLRAVARMRIVFKTLAEGLRRYCAAQASAAASIAVAAPASE